MVTEQASNGTRVKSAVTRLPGIDGVRALAVIAVIAFHEQLSVLPGGFLGVDVFFVLSGYSSRICSSRSGTSTAGSGWATSGLAGPAGCCPPWPPCWWWSRRPRPSSSPASWPPCGPPCWPRSPTPATGGRRCTTSRTSPSSGRHRRCSTCGHWPSRSSSTWSARRGSIPGLLRHRHPLVRAAHRLGTGAQLAAAPAARADHGQGAGGRWPRAGRAGAAGLGDGSLPGRRPGPVPGRAAHRVSAAP